MDAGLLEKDLSNKWELSPVSPPPPLSAAKGSRKGFTGSLVFTAATSQTRVEV